jgi:hypothetical protein
MDAKSTSEGKQWPKWDLLMNKTRRQNSYTSVPLIASMPIPSLAKEKQNRMSILLVFMQCTYSLIWRYEFSVVYTFCGDAKVANCLFLFTCKFYAITKSQIPGNSLHEIIYKCMQNFRP